MAALSDRWSCVADRAFAVRLYYYLAEHVSYYDDFSGCHRDFWDEKVFMSWLAYADIAYKEIPADIDADQWELMCPELELVLKTVGCFMIFWINEKTSLNFSMDVAQVLPLLTGVIDTVARFDSALGREISSKTRGDILEDLPTRWVCLWGESIGCRRRRSSMAEPKFDQTEIRPKLGAQGLDSDDVPFSWLPPHITDARSW